MAYWHEIVVTCLDYTRTYSGVDSAYEPAVAPSQHFGDFIDVKFESDPYALLVAEFGGYEEIVVPREKVWWPYVSATQRYRTIAMFRIHHKFAVCRTNRWSRSGTRTSAHHVQRPRAHDHRGARHRAVSDGRVRVPVRHSALPSDHHGPVGTEQRSRIRTSPRQLPLVR
ncbi:unnamed protein product [Sphagnum balticum]